MEANLPPVSAADNQENRQDTHVSMQHQPFFKKWGGLVVLSLALAIIIIDTTLLNVSLKTIIIDLHTNLKSMQWVITIYSLILAAFTITGGRLGDLFGRKKMFLVGAVVFAIGSFLASISKNVGTMIAGEAIIEGFGAAMMMPATASLLITNFKGRDRSIAFGVWGGIAAASSAIGPILGGWLTTNYSWRWGFRINIVVVALVLIGSFLIKENHNLRTKSKIDFVGIVLSALGLLSIVFGFIQASTYGWFKAKEQLVLFSHTINLGSLSATPVFIVLGLIILTAFVFWERSFESKGRTPLLSLHLFQNQQFISGASTMAVLALGQAGLFFTIPVFLQAVRHLDALHTGLTLLPMSIALLVAAPSSAFLVKFTRPKYLVQAGMALSLIAFVVLRATLSTDTTAWQLAPGFIIFGLGMGLIMAQVSNLTLSAVPVQEAGEASGVNNTMRMVGQTLGSAILGAILLSALISNVTKGIDKSDVIPPQAKQVMEAGISQHVSDISFGVNTDSATSNIPENIKNELEKITNQATVDANKVVMLYGMLFIFLGILVSTRLPNIKELHAPEAGPETDAEDEDEETTEEAKDEHGATYNTLTGAAAMAASQSTESKPEPKPESSQPSSRTKLWGGIALAVLVLAGLIYAYHSKNKSNDNTNAPEVITDSAPTRSIENSNANENSNTSQSNQDVQVIAPQGDSNATPAPTPPAQTPAPSTTPAQPGSTFTQNELHFSFNMPSTWKVVKDSNGETVFKSQGGLYNVQSSVAQGGDMNSLRTFLEQQSGISNIRAAKFGNRNVWQFDITGSYVTGYAFIENNRLYYVLGVGSENTPLVDLKTF